MKGCHRRESGQIRSQNGMNRASPTAPCLPPPCPPPFWGVSGGLAPCRARWRARPARARGVSMWGTWRDQVPSLGGERRAPQTKSGGASSPYLTRWVPLPLECVRRPHVPAPPEATYAPKETQRSGMNTDSPLALVTNTTRCVGCKVAAAADGVGGSRESELRPLLPVLRVSKCGHNARGSKEKRCRCYLSVGQRAVPWVKGE